MSVYDEVTLFFRKNWRKNIQNDPAGFPTEEDYVESELQRMTRTEFLQAISAAIDAVLEETGGGDE
jgi:hypothetical protein